MDFRASLYAIKYLGYFLTLFVAFLLMASIALGKYVLAIGLLIALVVAVMRLGARRMSFGETHFHYDGWFGCLHVPYSDILKVENSSKLGYPYDRFHGPNKYRITTPSGKKWVSLLWFQSEACRQFYQR